MKKLHVNPETGESLQAKRLRWVFGSPQPVFTTRGEAGDIDVGLTSLNYNIEERAYNYVTALNYEN